MPILKKIMSNVATMRFRVYMAILDSEVAQTVLDRARQLKHAAHLAWTDPRRLAISSLARFYPMQTAEIKEPVSLKPSLKATYLATSSLPIIFIHRSNSEHLKYSLAQAHQSNPNSTIFLLGDSSNDVYDFVEHRPFVEYFQEAAHFQKLYKHYSIYFIDFELICFQRWSFLREFLIAHSLSQCLYLDSDTMLSADIT